MNPSQILNGRGTELYGGRFAPIGTKGVYLADSDAGASAEVLARKKRLGGLSQISLKRDTPQSGSEEVGICWARVRSSSNRTVLK
jgi:RES domain-containing protein